MRRNVRAKIHFFKIFSISFRISSYKFIASEKPAFFAPFAQARPTKGDVFFRNAMKKQNMVFTFNFCLFTLYSLCLRVFVAETQSIKNEQLCKTNPISAKPKMNLNFYSTKYYENKSGLLTMEKQTQSNPSLPAYSGFTRHSVWRVYPPFTRLRWAGGLVRLRRIQKSGGLSD